MAARHRNETISASIPRDECHMGRRLRGAFFVPGGKRIKLAGREEIVKWNEPVRSVVPKTADIPDGEDFGGDMHGEVVVGRRANPSLQIQAVWAQRLSAA